MQLVEVRCPLPRQDNSDKACNKLCVRVTPGSSGEARCPRHEQTFEFHVDDANSFNDMITPEKPERQLTATAEHPTV